jgi:hypothetical protein
MSDSTMAFFREVCRKSNDAIWAKREPPQEQTVAQECPAVHGEDCTDDHCQCDCHFSYDDPHEDSREVNGR